MPVSKRERAGRHWLPYEMRVATRSHASIQQLKKLSEHAYVYPMDLLLAVKLGKLQFDFGKPRRREAHV